MNKVFGGVWCVTDAGGPSRAAAPAAGSRTPGAGGCLPPRPRLLADSGRDTLKADTSNGTESLYHLNRQCYRWNTAEEARYIYAKKKTWSSWTWSRNRRAWKSVIILDLYLWGCRAEAPLVPYWGADVRLVSSNLRDTVAHPDDAGFHMVNISKQPWAHWDWRVEEQKHTSTALHIHKIYLQHSGSYQTEVWKMLFYFSIKLR